MLLGRRGGERTKDLILKENVRFFSPRRELHTANAVTGLQNET